MFYWMLYWMFCWMLCFWSCIFRSPFPCPGCSCRFYFRYLYHFYSFCFHFHNFLPLNLPPSTLFFYYNCYCSKNLTDYSRNDIAFFSNLYYNHLVKKIYPSKVFFTFITPYLIIYTPLEGPGSSPTGVFSFCMISLFSFDKICYTFLNVSILGGNNYEANTF